MSVNIAVYSYLSISLYMIILPQEKLCRTFLDQIFSFLALNLLNLICKTRINSEI